MSLHHGGEPEEELQQGPALSHWWCTWLPGRMLTACLWGMLRHQKNRKFQKLARHLAKPCPFQSTSSNLSFCYTQRRGCTPLKQMSRDTWVAQSVKHLPSAQVMIPGSWDGGPHSSGLLLSGKPASPSPSLPACALSFSLSRSLSLKSFKK